MIEFNVNGIILDLPRGLKIDFKKKNILFAFDSIEVDRTTSFSLPKTPTNLRAFGFANDFHRDGEMMRRSIKADMICGMLTRRGLLYINQYDYRSELFECIFLTGELLELKAIKELGNISQFIPQELGARTDANGYASYDPTQPDYGTVFYETDRATFLPSWRLGSLVDVVLNNAGLSVDLSGLRSVLDNERIIVPSNYNLLPLSEIAITRTYLGQPQPPISGQDYPVIGEMSSNSSIFSVKKSDTTLLMVWDEEATDFRRGYVDELVCLQTVDITFPNDTPNDMFLGYVQNGSVVFLGDYSFNGSRVSGTPLAGRTITLQSGQHFYFVFQTDFVRGGSEPYEGWWFANRNITLNVQVEGIDGPVHFIRVRDNVPEMNIIELLKTIAVVTGRVLNYDGAIKFEELQGEWYRVLRLTDVVSVGKMTRTFGNFERNNYVEMDSAEYVTNRVRLNYIVDNAILQEDNVLQTIPFSEFGTRISVYDIPNLFLPQDSDVYTLAANTSGFYMGNINIPANNTIRGLTYTSTTIDVQSRMSLLQFDSINQKTIIYYDGAYWVWMSGRWSNDIAEMTLARMGAF